MNEIFETQKEKLLDILRFVENNKFSEFYNNKYGQTFSPGLNEYQDFIKVPFLLKDELLATPIKDRTFVPGEEIRRYSFSSGTTKSPKPLIVPHNSMRLKTERTSEENLKKYGVSKVLLLLAPFSPLKMRAFATFREIIPFTANINDLKLTAGLVKKIGIEAIFSTPTILYFFIQHLKEIDFDFRSVKYISLGGELCTKGKLSYFKKCFPQALTVLRYATTETSSSIGYQCEHLAGKSSIEYHINPNTFLEIVDEEGSPLEMGKVGEIVFTNLDKKALPLIRYKLSDVASISKEKCKCGKEFILKLGGRKHYDVLRFHEITLYAQLIEKALEEVGSIIYPQFQMHVYEEEINGKLLPRLVLRVQLRDKDKRSAFTKRLIQESVTRSLFLSADKTLKYFVDNKIFLPMEVEFTQWLESDIKHRNIVTHLE